MIILAKHIPSLQIIIPLMAALITVLAFNITIARIITIFALLLNSLLAFYNLYQSPLSYVFGSWTLNIGIEFKLDILSKLIILYIGFNLLFFTIFCEKLITETITNHIQNKWSHLFYAIILFAHVGYLGMASTNDLFNLYVFIEISSLSAYILMSLGTNPRSVVGAFDYLILGSIGATLILIGVGLLFSITGNLNLGVIQQLLPEKSSPNIINVAFCFITLGSLLKVAFFPMQYWMVRAYRYSPAILLIYIAGISNVIGIYLIFKFSYFLINYITFSSYFFLICKLCAYLAIIACGYIAVVSRDLSKILVYAVAAQMGYIILLLGINNGGKALAANFLLNDSVNKIGLFLIMAYWCSIKHNLYIQAWWRYLVAAILINSAGLPLTSMFILKFKLLEILYNTNLTLDFIIVAIGFYINLLYYYQIVKLIYFWPSRTLTINNNSKEISYSLIMVVLVQFLLLLYFDSIFNFFQNYFRTYN